MLRLMTTRILIALALAGVVTTVAAAQEWRGMGRVAGKVVDESGQPLEGVTVKATLPSAGNGGPGANPGGSMMKRVGCPGTRSSAT